MLLKAAETFTDLSDKYGNYVQGAAAYAHRGHVQRELGILDQATDSYLRMLEQPDADPLREAKFQAIEGLIRIWMAQSPPDYTRAIERGQAMFDAARPNEKGLASLQTLRVELAKAYLAKANDDDNQTPAASRRAKTTARQMLLEASKLVGESADEANRLLVSPSSALSRGEYSTRSRAP